MWETLTSVTKVNRVNVGRDERFFSVVAGSILLLYALIRIPFTAVLAFLAALYLVFRGVRGYCYLYDQLGQNTAVPLPQLTRNDNRETAVFRPAFVADAD